MQLRRHNLPIVIFIFAVCYCIQMQREHENSFYAAIIFHAATQQILVMRHSKRNKPRCVAVFFNHRN